jgi:hypothetical protein
MVAAPPWWLAWGALVYTAGAQTGSDPPYMLGGGDFCSMARLVRLAPAWLWALGGGSFGIGASVIVALCHDHDNLDHRRAARLRQAAAHADAPTRAESLVHPFARAGRLRPRSVAAAALFMLRLAFRWLTVARGLSGNSALAVLCAVPALLSASPRARLGALALTRSVVTTAEAWVSFVGAAPHCCRRRSETSPTSCARAP